MEGTPNTPSPPSSSSHEARNEDAAGSDQVQAQQQNSGTANDRPKSFADVARPLSKEKLRSAWGQIRARTERVEAEVDQPLAVAFTYHGTENEGAECILAIPYDRQQHSVEDVLLTAETTFPSAIICDYSTAGVLFLLFESKEERNRMANTALEAPSGTLRAMPAIRSLGTRIKIRVDDMNIATVRNRRAILTSIFGGYGDILHINDHVLKGSKLLVASFDFILELPQGTSKDLMLPRVASVMGQNVLFMWNSGPFCLRCGSDAHTKTTCPRPLDFKVRHDPALETPLMARAFADPTTPPREPIRKTTPSPKTPISTPAPSTLKDNTRSESTWTIVGSTSQNGRKRGRQGAATSASDSEPQKPAKKQPAIHNQPRKSETPTTATLISTTTKTREPTCEGPALESTSEYQDEQIKTSPAPHPQTSDVSAGGSDQDVDMSTESEASETQTTTTTSDTATPDSTTPILTPSTDVNMTTKADEQRIKTTEKKQGRVKLVKDMTDRVDRLLATGKTDKTTLAKAITRASAVQKDSKGIPQVRTATHPLI